MTNLEAAQIVFAFFFVVLPTIRAAIAAMGLSKPRTTVKPDAGDAANLYVETERAYERLRRKLEH
jgi:hypothetical protein